MAPIEKSGIAIKSHFGSGYAMSNHSLYQSIHLKKRDKNSKLKIVNLLDREVQTVLSLLFFAGNGVHSHLDSTFCLSTDIFELSHGKGN